jgi:hypothetical protein
MGADGRETSGVTTRVVVQYVRQHGGDRAVEAMLEQAGETRGFDELLDEHGWSSYEQKIRLFEAAEALLGDPDAVRRIGQSMLRSRIALPLLVLLRALGSPEQVLRNVAKANSRFSTNSTVQAWRSATDRPWSATACTTGTSPTGSTASTPRGSCRWSQRSSASRWPPSTTTGARSTARPPACTGSAGVPATGGAGVLGPRTRSSGTSCRP